MALSPGWLRTELALRAEPTPYIGRAVVAPARNGQVMRKSGRTLVVGELAYVYGLTVQSTAGRAVAVPDAVHRARLGIPRRQRLDLRAHDAEVVGVGRQLAAQVFHKGGAGRSGAPGNRGCLIPQLRFPWNQAPSPRHKRCPF